MASTSISSGLLAAGTTTVVARVSKLNSVQLIPDGTNAATITIYDNASAGSGTVLAKLFVAGTGPSIQFNFRNALRADNGLTVVLAGTGSGAIVGYDAA